MSKGKEEKNTKKLTWIIFGSIIIGFIIYVIIGVNNVERERVAEEKERAAYADTRGGKTIQSRTSYDYYRSGSFGSSTYVSKVSIGPASFKCNTPRNNSSWDIPIYFSDTRDGESGNFENRPNTRKALSRCGQIDYVDQFEFEIAKAKLLYKECGSEPGDKCFKSKYLPLLEELPKPKNK